MFKNSFPKKRYLKMRNFTKTASQINGRIGKAINLHQLIEDGDRILIAVSGGKDSLTLLYFLKQIQAWAPIKFEIYCAHIKTDFSCGGCMHDKVLTDIFEKLGVKHVFRNVKVLDENKQTTCFWCSWNKRKALFEIADELNCNKLALGHHKDDIVETVLLNQFCNGDISTMNPKQPMFKGKISIIRPMCLVEEDMIKTYAKEYELPNQLCKCPFGKDSKRKYMKDLLKEIEKNIPGYNVKSNIYNSLARIKKQYIDLEEVSDLDLSIFDNKDEKGEYDVKKY